MADSGRLDLTHMDFPFLYRWTIQTPGSRWSELLCRCGTEAKCTLKIRVYFIEGETCSGGPLWLRSRENAGDDNGGMGQVTEVVTHHSHFFLINHDNSIVYKKNQP